MRSELWVPPRRPADHTLFGLMPPGPMCPIAKFPQPAGNAIERGLDEEDIVGLIKTLARMQHRAEISLRSIFSESLLGPESA
jgi:hypothetical protein